MDDEWKREQPWRGAPKTAPCYCLSRGQWSITVGGIGNGLVSYLLHRGRDIIAARPAIPKDDRTARGRAVDELKTIAEATP